MQIERAPVPAVTAAEDERCTWADPSLCAIHGPAREAARRAVFAITHDAFHDHLADAAADAAMATARPAPAVTAVPAEGEKP